MWSQQFIRVRKKGRGSHLITDQVLQSLPDLERMRVGLLHLFLRHTSASLTINENADPDVRYDLEQSLNRIVPESESLYRHRCEGPDDMPAHVKSTLIGCELSIPVGSGKLLLGVWQGIYLVEHRDQSSEREVVATLMGEPL